MLDVRDLNRMLDRALGRKVKKKGEARKVIAREAAKVFFMLCDRTTHTRGQAGLLAAHAVRVAMAATQERSAKQAAQDEARRAERKAASQQRKEDKAKGQVVNTKSFWQRQTFGPASPVVRLDPVTLKPVT